MTNKAFKFTSVFLFLAFIFWFFSQQSSPSVAADLPPIVDGQQIVKMTASYSGYSPNRIKIRAGIPVSWQISSSGNPGCAGAIIAPTLFSGMISLIPNPSITKVFTATQPGTYRFSCSMGMYTGSFEVVN